MFMTFFSCLWPLLIFVISLFTRNMVWIQVVCTIVFALMSAWHLFTKTSVKTIRDASYIFSLISLTIVALVNLDFFYVPISQINVQQLVVFCLCVIMWIHSEVYLGNEDDN